MGPLPRLPLAPSDHMARSTLTGTSTRAAERSGSFSATAHATGVVAAAIAVTVDLTAARRSRFREVRDACQKWQPVCGHVCGR